MSGKHQAPYTPAARILLTAALVTLQGGIQLLGGFVTLLRADPSQAVQECIGHAIVASDKLAAHLSATKTGKVEKSEEYLSGHFHFLQGQRELAEIQAEQDDDNGDRIARTRSARIPLASFSAFMRSLLPEARGTWSGDFQSPILHSLAPALRRSPESGGWKPPLLRRMEIAASRESGTGSPPQTRKTSPDIVPLIAWTYT